MGDILAGYVRIGVNDQLVTLASIEHALE